MAAEAERNFIKNYNKFLTNEFALKRKIISLHAALSVSARL